LLKSSVYYILHIMTKFGPYIKQKREQLGGKSNSLRKVAEDVNIEPSYLSKIERGLVAPPGEEAITRIAHRLNLDKDITLAVAGKISSDLHEAITRRPELFARLIRAVVNQPEDKMVKIVEEIKDGEW